MPGIRITDGARKHGISEERIRYVVSHCGYAFPHPSPDPDEPDRLLMVGDDAGGVPLEVLAVELPAGGLVVIHAMRMRAQYRNLYEEALPWRTTPSD